MLDLVLISEDLANGLIALSLRQLRPELSGCRTEEVLERKR